MDDTKNALSEASRKPLERAEGVSQGIAATKTYLAAIVVPERILSASAKHCWEFHSGCRSLSRAATTVRSFRRLNS